MDKKHLEEVHEEIPEYNPLRLKAIDEDGVMILSSTLQDAVFPISAIAYEKEEGAFKILANRYCWEAEDPKCLGHRVHAGISFGNVESVRQKGIDFDHPEEILTFLSMEYHDNTVRLIFAGGKLIEIKVNDLECKLADFDAPYPTHSIPDHEKY